MQVWFPVSGRFPGRRAWQPTPVFLPGESRGQRSLEGYQQSIGLHRVTHDSNNLVYTHALNKIGFILLNLMFIPETQHWFIVWKVISIIYPQHSSKSERYNYFNQFISVIQSYPTLCNPMDCSTPGLPVHHQLLDLTQIHIHWVGDAIQSSHPLSSPSPPTFSLSQHQGLFQWVSYLHQVAKVLEFQLQRQSFQWTPRTDLL